MSEDKHIQAHGFFASDGKQLVSVSANERDGAFIGFFHDSVRDVSKGFDLSLSVSPKGQAFLQVKVDGEPVVIDLQKITKLLKAMEITPDLLTSVSPTESLNAAPVTK